MADVLPTSRRSLLERAMEPIDGLWLALFRIGFGACMVWQAWYYFSTDLIRAYFVDTPNHFTFVGFDWVKPWPADQMYLHFFVLGVAAMCILLGFYYRTACAVFCVGFTHFFLMDRAWYLNHYYLICLLAFLAVFLPANRELSIDAWRYPELRGRQVPRWTLWLLRFQLGVPYFFGGIAKINRDWIFGEPMRTWLKDRNDTRFIGQFFEEEWCVNGFVWGGMLLDLFVIPLLLWKRTRIPAMIVMALFHLLNTVLFDIGVFPWLMLIATVIVFTPPKTTGRLRRSSSTTEPPVPEHKKQKLLLVFFSVYVCWQLLMPLRHFFYAGQTAFTREGHYFSWRMKLNNLYIDPVFTVFDPETNTSQPLPTSAVLQNFQAVKIRDADQVLQITQWLKESLPADTNNLEIRCRATVGLNGRPPTLMFDPSINLLSKQRQWTPIKWINLYPEPRLLRDLQKSDEP